jgi:endonuclease IV
MSVSEVKQKYLAQMIDCNHTFWGGGFDRKRYNQVLKEYERELKEELMKLWEMKEVKP